MNTRRMPRTSSNGAERSASQKPHSAAGASDAVRSSANDSFAFNNPRRTASALPTLSGRPSTRMRSACRTRSASSTPAVSSVDPSFTKMKSSHSIRASALVNAATSNRAASLKHGTTSVTRRATLRFTSASRCRSLSGTVADSAGLIACKCCQYTGWGAPRAA